MILKHDWGKKNDKEGDEMILEKKPKRVEVKLSVFNEDIGFVDFPEGTYGYIANTYGELVRAGIDVGNVCLMFNVKGNKEAVAVLACGVSKNGI